MRLSAPWGAPAVAVGLLIVLVLEIARDSGGRRAGVSHHLALLAVSALATVAVSGLAIALAVVLLRALQPAGSAEELAWDDVCRWSAPGARLSLPTVRRLAGDLGLAPGTVARAYRELESDGVIVTRGRHGTFAASSTDAVAREAGVAARTFHATVRRLGVPAVEALAVVEASLADDGGATSLS